MGEFRFKQFSVAQDRCAMKVGTDGVLLGAWVPLRESDRRVLDVGCGTGVIALMIAQRHPQAWITALDIDTDCVAQAQENVDRSPWPVRIEVCCSAVQHFAPDCLYDLIVSNPPYFVDSLQSPDPSRTMARHAVSLPFRELLQAAERLLQPQGRLAVILPVEEGERFLQLASSRWWLVRRTEIRTTIRRPVKRVMLCLSRVQPDPAERIVDCLTIQTDPETFTPEYRALTEDFYLKF